MSSACTPVFVGIACSVLEIWVPFKNGQISLSGHGLYPWSSKNVIDRNWLKKFMQVGIDVECMHTNFGGCGLFGFGDIATFQKRPSKNLIDWNRLKKFMQVGIDVECMHTDFGGHGLFGFGDMATFQKRPNFPFGAWTIVHGHQKI